MKHFLLSLLLLTLLPCLSASGEQREAFPGAEGYGRLTTGGRGGAVYHVTTLEDNDQPGSFRYACNRSGKRTIVFDVSGTIYLKSALALTVGNVTIAGQTAPGDGICIADYPFTINANNVIIRFVRFRLGNRQVAFHEGDGLGGMDRKNIIVDHCSVSWSVDECLSVYGSEDITVQWCIVSHSLRNSGHSKGAHGYGGNWGGSGASYHHNLMANHAARTPRLGPRPSTQTDERMDFRNNVIYNYGTNGCYGGEGMNVNMVNNYYRPGSASNSRKARITGLGIRTVDYCLDKAATVANYNKVTGKNYTSGDVSGKRANDVNQVSIGSSTYNIDMDKNTITVNGTPVTVVWNGWKPMLHTWGRLYVDGNYNSSDATVSADNWTTGIYSQVIPSQNDNYWNDQIKQDIKLDTPIDYVYTTTHSAKDAFEKVIAYAGASLHRDEYDSVVTKDAKNGTTSFTSDGIIDSQNDVVLPSGTKGWPVLAQTAAPADTDGDGMPDDWEKANGLDPDDAADGAVITSDGYSNLEHYINSLVDSIMTACNEGGKMLSGNLESGDAAVELPEYSDDAEPVAKTYEISSLTYQGSADGNSAKWLFDNGISVTNAKSKGYATGTSPYIKFSALQFTVNLPEGLRVGGVTFEGYDNYADGDSRLSEVNGTDCSSMVFPAKNPNNVIVSHDVTFAKPVTGSFTFTIGGKQVAISLKLHTVAQTGIEETLIDSTEGNADTRIFNLMGVEVSGENLAPGIYIRGGKKFIVR